MAPLNAPLAQSSSNSAPIRPSSPIVIATTASALPAARWRPSSRCPRTIFTPLCGKPKAFHYIANSGKGLDRNFCPECGSRVFTTNLDSFPKTVFVQLGSLDRPDLVAPKLEMFTRRRMSWNTLLNLPQFEEMPH